MLLRRDLSKRETPDGKALRLQERIPCAVSFESITSRAVMREAITFDDGHLFSPKKIDAVWANLCLEFKWRESADETQTQHSGFQHTLRLFGIEAPFIQHVPNACDSGASLLCDFKQRSPGRSDGQFAGYQVVLESPTEIFRRPCRNIEEGSAGRRRGYVVVKFVINESELNRPVENKIVAFGILHPVHCQYVNFLGLGKRDTMEPRSCRSCNE